MRISRLAVTLMVVAVLALNAPAYAEQGHNNLALTFNGAIVSSGIQSYSHDGGRLVSASGSLLGNPVDHSKAKLDYSLRAQVSGLTVSGEADFKLTIKVHDGSFTTVKGVAPIADMITAEVFPLGCTTDCTSAVPGAFLGLASITVQTCHSQDQSGEGSTESGGNGNNHDQNGCSEITQATIPMVFESAFLNPFGKPIFMADATPTCFADPTTCQILMVANYSHARVTWAGIQLGGLVTGHLAGKPVGGQFAMTVAAVEDLKAGREVEKGTIALSGMSDPSLNAAGHFDGKSTIPPGQDCSGAFGFPPGTCNLTGFESKGDFSMEATSGGSIKGSYSTQWSVPAVAFTSSITGNFDSGHEGSG